MTILQVLYMVEVARSGSMSKAAEALQVSQPALSLQVKRLEEEVGCQLFHRTPQGVSLTAAGAAFFEDALPIVERWNRLQEKTRRLSGTASGLIRIGVGARAMSNGLFEATVAFFEQHPEADVSFLTDLSDNPLDALRQKKIDLAIDRMPPESMVDSPEEFWAVELLRERQCILLSLEDPRAQEAELPFVQLNGQTVISGPKGSLDDSIMEMHCRNMGVQPSRVYRVDNIDAVMALIRNGKGVALGPTSFAQRYGVAAVPMVPETAASLHLICLRQNRKNLLVTQMEEYLKDFVAQCREI